MSGFAATKIESARNKLADRSWSPQEYFSLLERLEDEAARARAEARRRLHERVWELARQQGVAPIRDIKELQGDFWPEDESVDEFLDWVRKTRQQD